MIELDIVQYAPEWYFARLGMPTASQFSRILTAKTRKLAAGSETYMHELLSEWLTGIPYSFDASGYMERGTQLEPEAVAWYEWENNVVTREVGFCLRDDKRVGCSPDRLVGDDGGLEIKCPAAKGHVANMLNMSDEYFAQVQGCLWITGRAHWDLVSYHPTIPSVIVRIERDEKYIADLDAAMTEFLARLSLARVKLIEQGAQPATELDPEFAASIDITLPIGAR